MEFQDIYALLADRFPDYGITTDTKNPQPALVVPVEKLVSVCQFLHENAQLYFDYLPCITGIDNGPEKGTMELIFNLTSIPYGINLVLKTLLPRNEPNAPLPVAPTVSHIWRTADWHEREIFDLLGITFENHPDLRRILLPEDWQGHPLRKDYAVEGRYHGIYIRFEDGLTQEKVSTEDRR